MVQFAAGWYVVGNLCRRWCSKSVVWETLSSQPSSVPHSFVLLKILDTSAWSLIIREHVRARPPSFRGFSQWKRLENDKTRLSRIVCTKQRGGSSDDHRHDSMHYLGGLVK
jgi:hypothetical protein